MAELEGRAFTPSKTKKACSEAGLFGWSEYVVLALGPQTSPVAGLAGVLKIGERSLVSFFLRSAQVGITTRLR